VKGTKKKSAGKGGPPGGPPGPGGGKNLYPIRTVACKLRATLHYETAQQVADIAGQHKFFDENIPRGRGSSETPDDFGQAKTAVVAGPTSDFLPGRRTNPNAPSGRGVVMIRPGQGDTGIRIQSWNSGAPVPQTNDSHAERQFMNWFGSLSKDGLVKVELAINLSPCSRCAQTLLGVTGEFERAISWDNVYYGVDRETGQPYDNCTTVEDVQSLSTAWPLAAVVMPTLTDAEKAAARQQMLALYEQATTTGG
jgi:hypothetical protein